MAEAAGTDKEGKPPRGNSSSGFPLLVIPVASKPGHRRRLVSRSQGARTARASSAMQVSRSRPSPSAAAQ